MKTKTLFKLFIMLLGLWIVCSAINLTGVFSTRESTSGSFENSFYYCLSELSSQALPNGCRYSDGDLKENIQTLSNSLEKVQLLRPVTFNYKVEALSKPSLSDTIPIIDVSTQLEPRTEVGFIAQEIQIIFPDIVHEDQFGNLYVDYVALIPFLVKSLQEQQIQIEEMQVEIEKLRQ